MNTLIGTDMSLVQEQPSEPVKGDNMAVNGSCESMDVCSDVSLVDKVDCAGSGKLVLVESCSNIVKDDTKESRTVNEGGVPNSGTGNVDIGTRLVEMSQQLSILVAASERTNLVEDQTKAALKAMQASIDTLSLQMREMTMHLLRFTLNTTHTTGTFISMKQEQMFRPQDQVFLTPKKKMDQSTRLDVTPESTKSADVDQQTGVSSTVIVNSRRSLIFPKSLEALLDGNKENCEHNGSRTLIRDAEAEAPTPKLSLVQVKQEQTESPPRDSKFGLLVLADAALTRSPEHSDFFKKSSELFPATECDSGRSSGSSTRNNSPTTSQDEIKVKIAEKFARAGVYNYGGMSKTTTSSSSPSSTDAKSRKRRKVKQPLPCNFCGKCFNNQSSLRQHESFHRPVRPFKCESENCDKAYKTRSELNRHLVVHSGEKKHECKLCGKRFLRKQYLKTHLLRHHETGIAMVAPSAIDSFKDDSGGTIPSIVVSSSLVSKTEPLTYRCTLCYKIFVNNEDLSRHVRSYHDKKKAYVDEKMNTSFIYVDNRSLNQKS